jgi:geranylgeranyl diphosphate synthase type II
MSKFCLATYLSERKAIIDEAIRKRLIGDAEPASPIDEAMIYATLSDGKRLRPIFTLATADLAGVELDALLDTACAIELTHAASLILDDLPCMDNAKIRRAVPCTHIHFDEATAILAAMGLLARAFELVAQNAISLERPQYSGELVQLLSRAIGTNGLVYGQHLDLQLSGSKPSVDELEVVHHHKAGALFLAALKIPAVLLGFSNEETQAVQTFATDVGLAFQITDDLIDAKDSAEDEGKHTFASHLGLDASAAKVDCLIGTAENAVSIFNERAEVLRQMAEYVRLRTS